MQGEHAHEWETVLSDIISGTDSYWISCVRVCFRCGKAEREKYKIEES